jgi:hypothetical protein
MSGTAKVGIASVGLAAVVGALYVGIGAQEDPAAIKERLIALGRQHPTADALYNALKAQAAGGQRLRMTALPDRQIGKC